MLRLILIRHCETDWAIEKRYQGNKDVPLNLTGRRNAVLLGNKIKTLNYKISKIYSSCLSRAYETAKVIKDCMKFKGNIEKIEKICELNERNFGDWEGKTYDEILSKYGKSKMDEYIENPLNFSIPNAETFKEFKDRVLRGLNFILDENKEEIKDANEHTIMVVAHGGTNRIIICDALNSFENFFTIKQDFCSINILEYYENLSVIALMNENLK